MSETFVDEAGPSIAPNEGISALSARRLEYSLIGLGVFALALIFQPFSLSLFGFGCALVVVSGLLNNLLPLCRMGTTTRTLFRAGFVVALIFCIVLLISLTAAYLYGVFFVTAFAPDDSTPFYKQPFVWGIVAVAVLLAGAVFLLRPPPSSEHQPRAPI